VFPWRRLFTPAVYFAEVSNKNSCSSSFVNGLARHQLTSFSYQLRYGAININEQPLVCNFHFRENRNDAERAVSSLRRADCFLIRSCYVIGKVGSTSMLRSGQPHSKESKDDGPADSTGNTAQNTAVTSRVATGRMNRHTDVCGSGWIEECNVKGKGSALQLTKF
jgi:hypothetical protein